MEPCVSQLITITALARGTVDADRAQRLLDASQTFERSSAPEVLARHAPWPRDVMRQAHR